MLSAEVVNIVAPTEHQRTVVELARDWRKAQHEADHAPVSEGPQVSACDDGLHVVIQGFPVAALPVLTRDKIPFELRGGGQ